MWGACGSGPGPGPGQDSLGRCVKVGNHQSNSWLRDGNLESQKSLEQVVPSPKGLWWPAKLYTTYYIPSKTICNSGGRKKNIPWYKQPRKMVGFPSYVTCLCPSCSFKCFLCIASIFTMTCRGDFLLIPCLFGVLYPSLICRDMSFVVWGCFLLFSWHGRSVGAIGWESLLSPVPIVSLSYMFFNFFMSLAYLI